MSTPHPYASLDAGRERAESAALCRSSLARIVAALATLEDETALLSTVHPEVPAAAAAEGDALGKLRLALGAVTEEERAAERWVASTTKAIEHAAALLLVHVGIAVAVEPSTTPSMTLPEVRAILGLVKDDDEPIMGATRSFDAKDIAFFDYAIPRLGAPAERGIVAAALPMLFGDAAPVCTWIPVLHDDPAGVRFAELPETARAAVTGWFLSHGWDVEDIDGARWAPAEAS